MLGQCRRRCSNIIPTLYNVNTFQFIVEHRFPAHEALNQCCYNVVMGRRRRHWLNVSCMLVCTRSVPINRSGCGSKLKCTGFESWPDQMFLIGVGHIQCSKLFKGLECNVVSVYGTLHYKGGTIRFSGGGGGAGVFLKAII